MLTINRYGLKLKMDEQVIPAKGSKDVPVRLINDSTYSGYAVSYTHLTLPTT